MSSAAGGGPPVAPSSPSALGQELDAAESPGRRLSRTASNKKRAGLERVNGRASSRTGDSAPCDTASDVLRSTPVVPAAGSRGCRHNDISVQGSEAHVSAAAEAAFVEKSLLAPQLPLTNSK